MKYACVILAALAIASCGLFSEPIPDVLGPWQATSSLTVPRLSHAAVAHNGYLYVLGGSDGVDNWIDHVEYAPVHEDGTLGEWAVTTPMPYPARKLEAFAHDGYLYAVGGNGTSGLVLDDVIYAPINSDGSLGAWSPTTDLSSSCYEFALVEHNGSVVVLGGGFSRTQTVEYAEIQADGSVGAWQAGPDLLQARQRHGAAVNGGTIYLVGGDDGSLNYVLDIESSSIGGNGEPGAWSEVSSIGTARMLADAVVVGDYLFALGGTSAPGTVEFAVVAGGGAPGEWEAGPSFTSRTFHASAVSGTYIYVTGGYDGGPVGTVEFAPMQR
jgi:hypothetical protein